MPPADVTTKVAVNLLLIALGYLIKKAGVLSREDGRALNRLVLFVTLPATSLQAITGAELTWSLLVLPLAILVGALMICALGTIPARALKLSRADTGTFVVALCGFMASMAYPFAEAAFDVEGVRALAICDLGNALAIFGAAYYLSFRYSANGHFSIRESVRKVLTSFPLLAFVTALLLNVSHVRLSGLPGNLIASLAKVNSPLMLLSLGVYLELDLSRQESKVLIVHTVFKYTAGLLVAFLLFFAIPYRGPQRAITFLVPLMPAPLSTLLYAAEQGLNSRLAAMLISLGMLISLAITTVTVLAFRSAF
jgi:hypothetical protein